MNVSKIFIDTFSRLSRTAQLSFIVATIVFLGIIEQLTSPDIAFSLFYLIPVSLSAWLFGRNTSTLIASFASITWLAADLLSGHFNQYIPFLNTFIRLSVFLIVTSLILELRQTLEREKKQASTDHLTGALNNRAFFKALNNEILRAKRYKHPFTVAYLDLDNFKQVNDEKGHTQGDEVLKDIVHILQSSLRAVDTVARLGGDEFAVLLPETDKASAEVVLNKINAQVLKNMQSQRLPVTMSAGVISYERNYPNSSQDVIKIADTLMYQVKSKGKNAMTFEVYN